MAGDPRGALSRGHRRVLGGTGTPGEGPSATYHVVPRWSPPAAPSIPQVRGWEPSCQGACRER